MNNLLWLLRSLSLFLSLSLSPVKLMDKSLQSVSVFYLPHIVHDIHPHESSSFLILNPINSLCLNLWQVLVADINIGYEEIVNTQVRKSFEYKLDD